MSQVSTKYLCACCGRYTVRRRGRVYGGRDVPEWDLFGGCETMPRARVQRGGVRTGRGVCVAADERGGEFKFVYYCDVYGRCAERNP